MADIPLKPRCPTVTGPLPEIRPRPPRAYSGGVYNEGLDMKIIAPDSRIALNHAQGVLDPVTGQTAGGYRGGLMVLRSSLPVRRRNSKA